MGLGMQAVWFSYLIGRVAVAAAMTTTVFGESKRVVAAATMTVVVFWESKGHSFLFVAYISPLNVEGCLEGWLPLFLSLFGSSQGYSCPL
jgi:hypothetical protein